MRGVIAYASPAVQREAVAVLCRQEPTALTQVLKGPTLLSPEPIFRKARDEVLWRRALAEHNSLTCC